MLYNNDINDKDDNIDNDDNVGTLALERVSAKTYRSRGRGLLEAGVCVEVASLTDGSKHRA